MNRQESTAFAETLSEGLAARRLRAERAKALFGDDAGDPMTIGRFVLEDQLGEGGQGAVFVAWDPKLDRKVALKRLHSPDPRRTVRLLEEARALARLQHDNVVQVYEVGTDDIEGPFMVMELVDGTPLRTWLEAAPRPWMEIVGVLIGVAHGLAAMHDKDVVHRDVKPENVIIDPSGRAKLVDLGIALWVPGDSTASDGGVSPATPEIAGTHGYMAPEQLLGVGVGTRSDQYGLCTMLHEAIYHELPHPRRRRKRSRWLGRGETSRAIDRVIERGLKLDPDERFASMGELAARLEAIVRWRRRAAPSVAAAVLLVVLVGGLAWALHRAEGTPCERAQTGAEVWSQAQRDVVKQAFVGAGSLDFTMVDVMLSDYVTELDVSHVQACAALVSGEQEPSIAHARLACLARSQGVLTHVVDELATVGATEIEGVVERLGRLPPVAACSSTPSTEEVCEADEPVDGHDQAVEDIGLKLQAAEARVVLGRYDEGLRLAQQALALAEPEALQGIRARAWLVHGRLAYEAQQPQTAIASLRESLSLAERSGCDGVAAEALSLMTKVRALQKDDDADEALRWSQQALDKLERLGDAGLRRADALNSRGLVLHHRFGRLDEADALYREAAALREQYLPASALALTDTLLNRGTVLAELGRLDEAIVQLERALALRSDALGTDHPSLYKLNASLGNRQLQRGDLEAAKAAYARAIALAEAGLGPRHAKVGDLLLRLVHVFAQQHQYDEALEHALRSEEIYSASLETTDLRWSDAWGAIAQVHLGAGRPSEAVPWLRKAWELVRTHPQATPLDHALATHRLGSAEAQSRSFEAALAWFEQALALSAPIEGSMQMDELRANIGFELGSALLELGRHDEAIPALERAARWWAERDGAPERLAHARWRLARALLARGDAKTDEGRARIERLVREAAAFFRDRPEGQPWRAEFDGWRVKQGFE